MRRPVGLRTNNFQRQGRCDFDLILLPDFTMTVGCILHRKMFNVQCTRRLLTAGSPSGVSSQSYHATFALWSTESRGTKKRHRGTQSSKSPVSDGRRDHNRGILNQSHKVGGDSRVSSEIRKLSLEDFPKGREREREKGEGFRVEKVEVLFGIAPCLLALTQRRREAYKLFVKDGEALNRSSVLKVCEEAERRRVPVQRVSKKELDRMCSGRVHQGVCLHASPLGYVTSEDRGRRHGGADGGLPLWLVLEGIQDPMNLGAILRSAYFLGVDTVATSVGHSCPLSPVVSKASSGAMEVLDVLGYESLEKMLRRKAAQGWHVVGTVGADIEEPSIPVSGCSDFQMSKPTLLLLGGEGTGLSPALLSLCQTLLSIPARGELHPAIDSLNVSVATGILLHSLLSSRHSPA